MSKKISYVLSTGRPFNFFMNSLNIVLNFNKHDHEIIVCSPKHTITDEQIETLNSLNIKWVEDDKMIGSAYGFNKGYWNSDGDYVCMMIDDVGLPNNYLNILDWFDSDFMKKKRFKIVNQMWDGGPGLYMYGHDDLIDGQSKWCVEDIPEYKFKPYPVPSALQPYCVIPLSTLSRETIEKELNGHIYHPNFHTRWTDHWLGFYVSKNEVFEKYKWRCPNFGTYQLLNPGQINTHFDNSDEDTFRELVTKFICGNTDYVEAEYLNRKI